VVPRGKLRERVAWSIAAGVLLAALVYGFLRSKNVRPPMPTYAAILPPDGASFQIEGDQGAPPALSPDGSAVVFGAGDELWYRSLRTGAQHILPGAHGAIFPFWSPDSSSIGFFADGQLKTLEINTGVIRTLCDAPAGRGGSWNASSIILFSPSVRGVRFPSRMGDRRQGPVRLLCGNPKFLQSRNRKEQATYTNQHWDHSDEVPRIGQMIQPQQPTADEQCSQQ